MARDAPDVYGSSGAVPTVQPTGLGAPNLSVHASPEDFGAQIGGAVQKVGAAGEALAAKYGQMVNENLMTKADVSFATKLGQLKADYTSKSGQAAWDAFPQYQADIAQAFQDSRANLPVGAQHGFDMLGARTMANHIADGSNHAVSQLKEQQRYNHSDLANQNVQALLDPNVAASPERSQYHLDTLHYAAQAQIDSDHPGLTTDPKTGTVSFDESTPQGVDLKNNFQQRLDTYLSQGYVNKYDTLAKQDVFAAHDAYQQDRDNIPKAGQVALDASFGPRIQQAHTNIATGGTLNEAAREHFEVLTNPQASSANPAIAFSLQHEGGYVPNDSGKGPTKYGINQEANPGVDVANLTQAQAAKIMHDKYFIGVGADKMAPDMAMVASDTAVNMGVDKAKALVAQAGDDPQKLIDLRRAEYQRLATENPAHYGQYLDGWNKRLDDLQKNIGTNGQTQPVKSYATNENGGPMTLADYYRTNSAAILQRGDAYAEQQMPGDLALKRSVRESLNNQMSKTIANENAQHIIDNRNVMRAVNGELTKGKPPETEAELRAIPGMSSLLDNIAARDPKFAESIPVMIAKTARRNDVTNSANGYDTIQRVLQPQDDEHPNHIKNQTQLDSLLGKSDGTGINAKDYNDAKPATELPTEVKTPLLAHMQSIATANGNIDGKGQQRAVQWYNMAMAAIKKNDALGDKKEQDIEKVLPPASLLMPSRMGQLTKIAEDRARAKLAPTIASPDDPAFEKLPSGSQFQDADGKMWTKK